MGFPVIKEISEEEMKSLNNISNELDKTPFIKLKDGQKIVLLFYPGKWRIVEKEFEDRTTKLYEFEVYDPNLDMDRIWDISNPYLVKDLVEHLKKKEFFLKIMRKGEGKQTTYFVEVAQE